MPQNKKKQGRKGKQHRHDWQAVNFKSMADDRIKCKVCGLVKICEHDAGESMGGSGCCFCNICGGYLGLAH
ncbi:MAG: hypothetical protein WCT16_00070 [Candidatus Buchananbacteria bacterium]